MRAETDFLLPHPPSGLAMTEREKRILARAKRARERAGDSIKLRILAAEEKTIKDGPEVKRDGE